MSIVQCIRKYKSHRLTNFGKHKNPNANKQNFVIYDIKLRPFEINYSI